MKLHLLSQNILNTGGFNSKLLTLVFHHFHQMHYTVIIAGLQLENLELNIELPQF